MYFKGANSIDEAVSQFYENPNKYTQPSAASMPAPVADTKNTKVPADAPPAYAPPAYHMSRSQHRPHTNAVIEAARVRARDEVRFNLT